MANKNVTCRVRLFKPEIKKLTQALTPALVKTAESIHTDLQQSQKMPFVTGNLQNESTFVDDKEAKRGTVYLTSSTPYARRLYYHPEYHFDKTENPNAGGKWLDDYLPSGKKQKFAQNAFNQFYKKEAEI